MGYKDVLKRVVESEIRKIAGDGLTERSVDGSSPQRKPKPSTDPHDTHKTGLKFPGTPKNSSPALGNALRKIKSRGQGKLRARAKAPVKDAEAGVVKAETLQSRREKKRVKAAGSTTAFDAAWTVFGSS